MHHVHIVPTLDRNENIFFSQGRVSIKLFLSSMHHSSIVARNKSIIFGDGRVPTEFFLSPMHDSNTITRNENLIFYILERRVPIDFLPSPIRCNS